MRRLVASWSPVKIPRRIDGHAADRNRAFRAERTVLQERPAWMSRSDYDACNHREYIFLMSQEFCFVRVDVNRNLDPQPSPRMQCVCQR
jgi:hypothetical protein